MTKPIRMYDPTDESISPKIHARLKPLWDRMPELEAEIRAAAGHGPGQAGPMRVLPARRVRTNDDHVCHAS